MGRTAAIHTCATSQLSSRAIPGWRHSNPERAYPAEPGDWSIKSSHEHSLSWTRSFCTRRCRLSWRCTVLLQAPHADPRKTTENVSDAGASMMHGADEDKVTA